ncbi:MAG: PAS domain S-box protein [Gammaproteobacteria bacterium]|nr:MAG: PAS domain S-box protein [Gammaproteobacteria bacterium]UTW42540.1 PAS domain-containing protein [bacterium SCSIO 12844]
MSLTFQEIKNNQTVPVIIANELGIVTFVNDQFSHVFGWRYDEIEGEPLTLIIPEHLHDAHHLGFARFITTGKGSILGQALDLLAVNKNGDEFNAEHVICAEKIDGQWHVAATITPYK